MIQWSYSSLKDYINCPKQYYHTKVAQDFLKKDTDQIQYGKEVHKALEDYVCRGVPLVKNYQRFQKPLDALLEINGDRYCEYEMALTKEKEPCAFDSETRWVRGVTDLLVIDGTDAYIIDYKTGSNKYPDSKQLKLMALMTYAHFPSVEKIKAGLLFVLHNSFISEEYTRNEINKLWNNFLPHLSQLEMSFASNTWVVKPGGLCGWCPVNTCKFYRER